MGQGDGHGEDTATNVAAGSGVAVCFTVCFCVIGIPLIIAGIILIAIGGDFQTAGIIIIVLSGIFLVIAIILVIAICTGCFGKGNNTVTAAQPGTTVVMTTHTSQQMYGGQQQAGYSGQPGQPMYGEQPPAYSQPQQTPAEYPPPKA